MNDLLPSHWDSRGTCATMKRVYYKDDVDKLLERALIVDSWDDAWEIQEAIVSRIKCVCVFAKNHKRVDDKEGYERRIEIIKRLYFFYKRLEQIRKESVR